MRRTETKFLVPIQELADIVESESHAYRIVRNCGSAAPGYRTLYFDDPGLTCFQAHHFGRQPRFKVRIRSYLERAMSYLEIKHASPLGRNQKRRWRIPFEEYALREQHLAALRSVEPTIPSGLAPRVWTDFQRATLLSSRASERITIDTKLSTRAGHKRVNLWALAIVEIKQEHYADDDGFMAELTRRGFRATSMSKYSTAIQELGIRPCPPLGAGTLSDAP